CVCTSTNPGVTTRPSASSTSRALPSTRPTAVTMPSVMATSAVRAGAPVPSTTVPPLIRRSCSLIAPRSAHRCEDGSDVLDEQVGVLERSEVSAAIEARVPLQVERFGSVRLGDAEHLLWEDGAGCRHVDTLAHRAEAIRAARFAVETHRRVDR